MPTNLALEDKLVEEAKQLGGHKTKREAVNQALAEYVAKRKQQKVLELFGKLEWDSTYNYKKARTRR